MKTLDANKLVKTYGKTVALNGVDLVIEPGKIYGLLGRNGAGKTTLLSILTAQNTHDSGSVNYGGQPVWENKEALSEICFSRELSPMMLFGQNTFKIKDYLEAAKTYMPHWDEDYANQLMATFGLNKKSKITKLSKGMMSMVTIVIALASKAPFTIMDEPVAGLDIVARAQFYKLLLEDYTESGRTFIISTHIIEEAEAVFENVIILDKGKVVENCNAEELIAQFHVVTGNQERVEAVTAGLPIVTKEIVGRMCAMTVRCDCGTLETRIKNTDVDTMPLSMSKVFVALTSKEG